MSRCWHSMTSFRSISRCRCRFSRSCPTASRPIASCPIACGSAPLVRRCAVLPVSPSPVRSGFVPHGRTLDQAVLSSLRRAHARGARMISICVGAFALAQAGILDGRPATTHWRFAAELADRYPAVDVRPDVLYVDDDEVLTSAGVSSGLDLCLHVVRKDLGVDAARRVSQALVAAPHREGNQAQFISRPLDVAGTGPIATLCALVKDKPWEEFTLEDMAARCSMSARTFTRRFRDATGTTPLQWVLAQRMDFARRMLEATDLSVDEIAQRCGFGTTLNLRTHFRRRLDTTPTAYRHSFHTSVI